MVFDLLLAVIFWMALQHVLLHYIKIFGDISKETTLIIKWIPAIVIGMIMLGAVRADRAVILKPKTYELVFNQENIDVVFLRTFSEYFLVWHPKLKTHEFIPRNLIFKFNVKATVEGAIKNKTTKNKPKLKTENK